MSEQADVPRAPAGPSPTRLRTRATLYFMTAALPSCLLSGVASVVLHRLVTQQIKDRNARVALQARRLIEDERTRVEHAVAKIAGLDALKDLVEAKAAGRPVREKPFAPTQAPIYGLEILAVVHLFSEGTSAILSNAHLARTVGDEAPSFLVPARGTANRKNAAPPILSGVALEYVDGNPPIKVPVLIAQATLLLQNGHAAVIYGGIRLDGHRLRNLASATDATVRLHHPHIEPWVFSPRRHAPTTATDTWTLDPLNPDAPPMTLSVSVHLERLVKAKRLFATTAVALVIGALLAAVLFATILAKRITTPILELSDAARQVGQGNLNVTVIPRSQDEVGGLVRVFNHMTKELVQARVRVRRAERVAAWQQIARRVAHEIKNPLFPIQMSMETLQKSYNKKHPKLDEIVQEATRTVLEEVRALNRIVTEFSNFARLPAPKRTPEDPWAILLHVHGLYKGPDVDGRVQLADPPNTPLPLISLDREQIGRALINLVKNALEALNDETGTVTLHVQTATHEGVHGVRFLVVDTGEGMPDDVKASLFTPYFTTKAEGTGLGLAIVSRIVEEHHGHIEVQSQPEQGTTFTLFIPADSPTGPAVPAQDPAPSSDS